MTDQIARLQTALAHRYAVERELGAGGMATVYLAEDLKHRRRVAVKVLRPELAETLGPERFLREIEIAANLNHPHILPLFDSGDADGFLYYVMPYATGESLRDRLNREKQLPAKDAIKITNEVADALDAAHERNVIHRDIKPENILLERGHAAVTDFGIARAISAAGGDSLTEIGIAVGTPEYMSPEQAAGESDLDGRSDVYALGLVLYEMLAGEVPLTGATFRATQARRMTETPAPISTVRPAVPPRVDQVIRRALDPVPADRFSTAREFSDALMSATLPEEASVQLEPRRPATTSVAVIPFANLSPDPDNVYFSDGITEELINALARVEGLQVAARTSVFAFRGRPEDVREIGRQLGVGAILEGSVRKHGNRLRIAAQLVNVSDGYQMWSNTFDREFEDIFLIQEEISRAIIENLRVKLLPSAEQVLASHGTSNADAYNTYLKGRYHLQQRNWQAFERAIECFHQAIAADSGYAPSYAGLADAYLFLERYGVMPPDTAFPKAREACLKALETGPHLAEAHVPLAYLRMIGDWDSTTAEREFQRALALNPDSAAAHHLYAWFLASRGRLAEALGELDRALAVEPFRLISLTNRGTVLYFSREYEAAVDQLTNTLDLNGSFAAARQWLGRTLQAMGRHSAAVTQHRRAFELLGDDPESIASLGHALGGAGQHEEALSLAQRLEGLAATKYVAAYWEALLRLGLGEVERAIDGFEKAYEEHFDWVLFLHVDPIFDSLKGHARFERLIERVRQASA